MPREFSSQGSQAVGGQLELEMTVLIDKRNEPVERQSEADATEWTHAMLHTIRGYFSTAWFFWILYEQKLM